MDSTQMPLERMNLTVAGDVADGYDAIGATRGQPLCVTREAQRHYLVVMDAQGSADWLASFCVPQAHLTVGIAGGPQFPIPRQANRIHSRFMWCIDSQLLLLNSEPGDLIILRITDQEQIPAVRSQCHPCPFRQLVALVKLP